LLRRDTAALDDAVVPREVLVDEEGDAGEALRDAQPDLIGREGGATYRGKSRCVRSGSTSLAVAVAPFGPART
jgi:hypothetical protein